MVVELDGCCRDEVVDHEAIVPIACIEFERAQQRRQDQIIAIARVHHVAGTADQTNRVVAAATVDDVGAGTHVDVIVGLSTDELVIAVAAAEEDARNAAADKLVLARTAEHLAARRPAQHHEAVIAGAALEVELGLHLAADVDEVVTSAPIGDDLLDRRSVIGVGLTQRTHDDL